MAELLDHRRSHKNPHQRAGSYDCGHTPLCSPRCRTLVPLLFGALGEFKAHLLDGSKPNSIR
jgi:hypothetical protein